MAAVMHEPAQRPLPMTERLADALRRGDADAFAAESPAAACLFPLLNALGWRRFDRALIEALPHFADDFDTVDLRNLLVTLGYESRAMKTRAVGINEQLMPCLFERDDGRLYVLLELTDRGVRVYDAQDHVEREAKSRELHGTAYVVTDTQPSHGIGTQESGRQAWSAKLLMRFRGLAAQLLVMTFFVNMAALAVPIFVMLVYDKVVASKSLDTLPYMLVGIGIALAADFGFRYLRAKLIGSIAGRMDYLIGVETFQQLVHMAPVHTERSSMAAQLGRLRQFDAVRDFFTGSAGGIMLELPFTLLFVAAVALIAGPIAIIPVVAIVAYLLLEFAVVPVVDSNTRRAGMARNDKQRMILQTLEGRTEIKSIGGEPVWLERFREVSGESATASYRNAMAGAVANAAGQTIMSLTAVAIVWAGAAAVMAGELTVGALIACMALVWRVLSPLHGAFQVGVRLQQIRNALKQINLLMKIGVEREGSKAGLLAGTMRGEISLDRVSFRYGPDQDPALLGVSLTIAPGEILAIAGDTGAGKSTLLKLMAGMYRPQAGSLAMDGIDIRQLNATQLRRSVSYVPQKISLFHGTIAQNLRLTNPLASDDELRRAADEAGVLEDILALPDGFATRIGDNRTEQFPPGFVSGLALARALLRDVPVLLLDEPGNSLDQHSDALLMQRLERLRGRRTVVMVTHRPSHIRLASKAVYMEQGCVRLLGDPQKVLAMLMEKSP
jgi:ATP-binding cassette subfamily C protein/ATP-binding cassette subfamily C protein LapB